MLSYDQQGTRWRGKKVGDQAHLPPKIGLADANGKLDIPRDTGHWLRDEDGNPNKALKHTCWDGCMFPNEVMFQPQTWNDILAVMLQVREAHGWNE